MVNIMTSQGLCASLVGGAVTLIGDGGLPPLCVTIIPIAGANGADVSTLANGGRGGNDSWGAKAPFFIGYPIVPT